MNGSPQARGMNTGHGFCSGSSGSSGYGNVDKNVLGTCEPPLLPHRSALFEHVGIARVLVPCLHRARARARDYLCMWLAVGTVALPH